MLAKANEPGFTFWAVLAALFALGVRILNDAQSRSELASYLQHWHIADAYRLFLSRLLDLSNQFFGSERPFSFPAFARCYQLAVIYPLPLLLAGWLFSGPSDVAGSHLLPQGLHWWQRTLLLGVLSLWALGLALLDRKMTADSSGALQRALAPLQRSRFRSVAIAGTMLLTGTVASLSCNWTAQGDAFAVLLGLALACAFAGSFASLGPSTHALLVAVVASFVVGTQIMVDTTSLTNAAKFGIVLIAATAAFAPLLTLPALRLGPDALTSTVLACTHLIGAQLGAMLVAYAFTSAMPEAPAHKSILMAWIIFFLVLPTSNSLFDFLSWGASRLLLKRASKSGTPLGHVAAHIGLDLVIAVVLLIGLCCTLPLLSEIGNKHLGTEGDDVLDWRRYADAAADSPLGAGVFVTLLLGTTLLPTVAHICFGIVSLLVRITPGREWTARALAAPQPSALSKTLVAGWFAGYATLAVVAVVGVVALVADLARRFGFELAVALREIAEWSASIASR
ncbi:MAG: hypothetical protein AAF533_11240 [Acidobacteriota bacterium]